MAGVEVIGLLCGGSTMFHDAAGGGGSGDRLSRSELAGLLAGLDGPAMNLALAKYAVDADAERLLIAQVRSWAYGQAVNEGWQIVKGRPTVCNMAALAVFEVVRPNSCRRCHGTGFKSAKVCPSCHGTCFASLSGRRLAEGLLVDESNYRRIWKARYERCFEYVRRLDDQVHTVLHASDRRCDLTPC